MLNKRFGKLFFLFTALIVAMGCGTADLSTDTLRHKNTQSGLREKAVKIYQRSLNYRGGYDVYKSFDSVRLRGADVWHSSFVRLFTPVTEQEQKFEVVFNTTGSAIKYVFLSGKRNGQSIGIEDGKTYRATKDKKEFTDSSKIRLYLEPLTHYFLWPYKLFESQVLLYAGEENIQNQSYHLIFASSGRVAASPEHDQYVIYVNKKTYNVDYIDFTLRSLFESYKGTLHYRNFKTVQGLVVPFFIGATDAAENKDFVHEFLFSEIQFS